MKSENPGRFTSLAEVAEDVGASRASVRSWLESAGVPAYCFGDAKNARVHYLRSDVEQWLENAEKWVTFFEKIGYPYGVRAYRTRIGEERMMWVFFVPSVADFHSDESWDDLVEAADAEAEMEELGAEWSQIVRRMEHQSSGYVESMSYVPGDM